MQLASFRQPNVRNFRFEFHALFTERTAWKCFFSLFLFAHFQSSWTNVCMWFSFRFRSVNLQLVKLTYGHGTRASGRERASEYTHVIYMSSTNRNVQLILKLCACKFALSYSLSFECIFQLINRKKFNSSWVFLNIYAFRKYGSCC